MTSREDIMWSSVCVCLPSPLFDIKGFTFGFWTPDLAGGRGSLVSVHCPTPVRRHRNLCLVAFGNAMTVYGGNYGTKYHTVAGTDTI